MTQESMLVLGEAEWAIRSSIESRQEEYSLAFASNDPSSWELASNHPPCCCSCCVVSGEQVVEMYRGVGPFNVIRSNIFLKATTTQHEVSNHSEGGRSLLVRFFGSVTRTTKHPMKRNTTKSISLRMEGVTFQRDLQNPESFLP